MSPLVYYVRSSRTSGGLALCLMHGRWAWGMQLAWRAASWKAFANHIHFNITDHHKLPFAGQHHRLWTMSKPGKRRYSSALQFTFRHWGVFRCAPAAFCTQQMTEASLCNARCSRCHDECMVPRGLQQVLRGFSPFHSVTSPASRGQCWNTVSFNWAALIGTGE